MPRTSPLPSVYFSKLQAATTVEAENVTINAADDVVQVNAATVTQADIMASNGVIHVIDTVLLPPSLVSRPERQLTDLDNRFRHHARVQSGRSQLRVSTGRRLPV